MYGYRNSPSLWKGRLSGSKNNKGGFPIFDNGTVTFNVVPGDGGLTGVAQDNPLPLAQVIPVHPTSTAGQPLAYGENLPSAILQAMVDLNVNGYPGPFACTLPLFMYADSFRLNQALVMPADRLFSLLHWYYTSPGLPQMPAPAFGGPDLTTIFPKLSLINTALLVQGIGMVISLGGHTAVHVNGLDPVIGFSQIDQGGNNIFRLRTRLANNISDSGAIRRLEFLGS